MIASNFENWPVCTPVVHPELLDGDAEGHEVEQRGDPAVEGGVVVARLHVVLELTDVSVLLLNKIYICRGVYNFKILVLIIEKKSDQ